MKAPTVTDPRIEGLPAVNKATKARDGQAFFLCAGIEQLTHDLRQGRAVSADAVSAAETVCQRAKALRDALDARYNAQVVIIEGDQVPA